MIFEEIVEIIELTDSDTLSEALTIFNEHGIVSDASLPFLDVIFAKASEHLCNKLKQVGFKGEVSISKININSTDFSYVIYDPARYCFNDAEEWLKAK